MTDTQAKALMGDMLAVYKARTLEEIADRLEERADVEKRKVTSCAHCFVCQDWSAAVRTCVVAEGPHTWLPRRSHSADVLREEATKIRAQAKELRAA